MQILRNVKSKYNIMKKKKSRDIEKAYPRKQFIEKLRRLADALETNEPFSIQVKNERLHIPTSAFGGVNIEHERSGKVDELEFQLKWKKK